MGHHALHCHKAIRELTECLGSQSNTPVALYPQPPRCTVLYCCLSGHTRPASKPFDCSNPNKQIWCATCRSAISGTRWRCQCGK
eukprot:3103696-Karenia_brevis.AAC.1